MSHRANFLDLDPTYTDFYGQPLLRMTFDFPENDKRMGKFLAERAVEIGQAMGGRLVAPSTLAEHYHIVPYQTTHNSGGAIIGADPKTSVVNRYLQSWDIPNLFVIGSCAFPQNPGYNPTDTVGALAYWSVEAMLRDYFKNPGPLVQA
jgi:gluconate 2-dehydrogenase alpha chain